MKRSVLAAIVMSLTSAQLLYAQHDRRPPAKSDSAFRALQERGKAVMGVNQYTSAHVFESLPDGGRIELQRDIADSTDVRIIRAHMQEVAKLFAAGDFSFTQAVHDTKQIPGIDVMRDAGGAIRYTYRELPRGGEVRLSTSDARAVKAIHDFFAFQRSDHRSHARQP
jgi:hypothetical protein